MYDRSRPPISEIEFLTPEIISDAVVINHHHTENLRRVDTGIHTRRRESWQEWL
jgi:hypothetical protein